MRSATWNVRGLYRAGSFMVAVREMARYKLDLVGVQEVRWDTEDSARADYNFFYGKDCKNHQLGTGLFVHHRLVLAVKTVDFVSYECHVQFREVASVISLFECACTK
jgi:exonuclease III